ncbi:MAG: hypothetical protein WC292_04880 [Clostridia bacterium]
MNKKTLAVLTYITDASKDGEAVILEKEELRNAVSPEASDGDITNIIKELTLTEMVNLKYQDEESYCLLPLAKGKLVAENEKTEILSTSFNLKVDYKRIARIAFFSAFFGALLAGAILGAIVYIINLIWD